MYWYVGSLYRDGKLYWYKKFQRTEALYIGNKQQFIVCLFQSVRSIYPRINRGPVDSKRYLRCYKHIPKFICYLIK